MRIGGIIDISTKDIPSRSSMVIFTAGCNFNCKFCHNKYLLQPNVGREFSIAELIDKINTNSLVSGVSITGGEPTIQNDLLDLCKEIQKFTDKYLSIDTNGSNPKLLKKLVPYINRVALDLKGPIIPEKYEKIIGVQINIETIIDTIELLNNQENLDFEIRTTYEENLLSSRDLQKIIESLEDLGFKSNFVLQQCQYREGVDEKFKEIFLKPEHETLINLLRPYQGLILPFNIFLRDEVVGYCKIEDLFN
ncbi:MAG: anaerobic ribonucleoside-triphosphate reductase activating protein [Candidatus Hermodarchaeota archaeon]